ncbi:MAG TPA: peptide MFS transporter [Gemmatimonadales bacterium]|nr:peptide MFS transporter [Gemmatimonadales bacterium]
MTSPTASAGHAPASSEGGDFNTAFFGHPRGLSTLFFTEMWERFSYYGMRAILILFMTASIADGGLGFDASKGGLILGTYAGMVYLMSVPGGWLADKFLGLRRAVLYGGVVIMAGHIALAIPSVPTFYLGLGLVIIGTGLLKPNISALVGTLYTPEDHRRDAGFSIYYIGINTGAFISPIVVGWLAQSPQWKGILAGMGISPETSWHWGFGAAAVGMFFGIVQYLAGWKYLGDAGMTPAKPSSEAEARGHKRTLLIGFAGSVALVAILYVLASTGMVTITPERVSKVFGTLLALTPVVLFPVLYFFGDYNAQEKKQLIVIMVLFFGATVFWSVFEQAASTLNLFADRNTDLTITLPLAIVLGLTLLVPAFLSARWFLRLPKKTPLAVAFALLVNGMVLLGIYYMFTHLGEAFESAYFQSANAMYIVVLAPLFATLWVALGDREPSSPAKFTVGLLFVALGFAILILAAKLSANGVRVSPLWLVATYFLHTVGELCLSPVGLSAMTRLAPARIVGLVLGIWFLATSLGNWLAGFASSMYEQMPLPTLFGVVTALTLVATVILAGLVGPMKKLLGKS